MDIIKVCQEHPKIVNNVILLAKQDGLIHIMRTSARLELKKQYWILNRLGPFSSKSLRKERADTQAIWLLATRGRCTVETFVKLCQTTRMVA